MFQRATRKEETALNKPARGYLKRVIWNTDSRKHKYRDRIRKVSSVKKKLQKLKTQSGTHNKQLENAERPNRRLQDKN